MDVVREAQLMNLLIVVLVDVSILVLMDVVREEFKFFIFIFKGVGFNPCSNGCRSGSYSISKQGP